VPEESASGEKVIYRIIYGNHNEKAIRDLQLTFFYPSDAMDIRLNNGIGQAINLQAESLKLENLEPGEEKSVEFSGYLMGSRGDIKKARAVLSFYGEGVPTNFKKEAVAVINISSWPVSLTLVAPPNAVSGQEVNYILDYRNESQEDLADLRFILNYPEGFKTSSKNIFDLKSLKKGEGDRISVLGILRGQEKEEKNISVTLQRKIEGVYINFEKTSQHTVISTPPLTTDILLNERKDYKAQPGDELAYQIQFTNNTAVDLFALTVSAKLDGTMFDFNSVQTSGTFNNATHTIDWDVSASPLLGQLAPGQTGAVYFKVKVKDSFPSSGTGVKDSIVKVSAKAETASVPPDFDLSKLLAESELTTKIIEPLSPTSEVLP
ncbi:MAG: hypothetical protein Q7K28_03150, partial [Candidatus Wildermuthbacteria bacterium]|nr:hypothetical protein [Candidatus Wildermuthbacteria bacterium]